MHLLAKLALAAGALTPALIPAPASAAAGRLGTDGRVGTTGSSTAVLTVGTCEAVGSPGSWLLDVVGTLSGVRVDTVGSIRTAWSNTTTRSQGGSQATPQATSRMTASFDVAGNVSGSPSDEIQVLVYAVSTRGKTLAYTRCGTTLPAN